METRLPPGSAKLKQFFETLHLLVVFELLQRENVLVKIFLKLLVRIVDVELLKAVDLWRNVYFRTLFMIPS